MTGRIKEQGGLVIVPVKIQFDKTYQFAAGSANISVTRLAECSENSEGCFHQILTGKTDRSEDHKSYNESLIKRIQRGRISLTVLPVKVSLDEISQFSMFSKQTSIVRNRNAGYTTLLDGTPPSINQAFENRVMTIQIFVWEMSEVQVFGIVQRTKTDLGHFPCATDFSYGLNLAKSELSFSVQ